jgi:hypothetical protein
LGVEISGDRYRIRTTAKELSIMDNKFVSWLEEVKDDFNELFEVRAAFVPKVNWDEYYAKGLSPIEAIDSYCSQRYTQ